MFFCVFVSIIHVLLAPPSAVGMWSMALLVHIYGCLAPLQKKYHFYYLFSTLDYVCAITCAQQFTYSFGLFTSEKGATERRRREKQTQAAYDR